VIKVICPFHHFDGAKTQYYKENLVLLNEYGLGDSFSNTQRHKADQVQLGGVEGKSVKIF
jgi:hypothetical protein